MTCNACGTEFEELHHNGKCRPCYNGYMNDYMKRRYHSRRAELIRLLGSGCIDCGSDDDLQFDHAEASKKSFDVAKRLHTASWKVLLEEVDKCVLRCRACHLNKTQVMRDDGSVDHGGGLTGKNNCYCGLCKPLKQSYMSEWYQNKRGKMS